MSNLRRGRALIVALATISCGRAAEPRERTSELDDAAVATWIDSAIYARQTHGADFYARNVVDDWSEGTSDGVFRTKAMMLRQLRDSSRAGPMKECHSNMILRGYGRTVVVTYTRTTSSHRDRECSETTSIRTDTFVKINGRWMQIASHSSSASREPTMDAFGAATHLPSHATGELAAIGQWELDELDAERTGDINFFETHLAEDWTEGMRNGAFRTKQGLISALRHPASGFMPRNSISSVVAREYGDGAVATFTASYDVLLGNQRETRQIITTDTFVKDDRGRWMQIASHSSPARSSP